MKVKSIATMLTILAIGIVSITTLTVLSGFFNKSPEDVVRQYWKYALEKNLAAGKNLACMRLTDCITSKDETVKVASDAIDSNGNKITSRERTVEDCCYAKEIGDEQLEVKDITKLRDKGRFAQFIVETENKNKQKEKYLNCLVKDVNSEKWKVHEVKKMNALWDYSKPELDACKTKFEEYVDEESKTQ